MHVCVFKATVRFVMAITVLLEALSLFLCDCPQQEVMSPVFSSLNTGNGPERNTARYVCLCQSVWGNNEGEKSIIRPSVEYSMCELFFDCY